MDPRTFSSSGHLPCTLTDSVSNVNSEKVQKKPKTGGVGLQGPGRRMRRLRTFSTPIQCRATRSKQLAKGIEMAGKQATTNS